MALFKRSTSQPQSDHQHPQRERAAKSKLVDHSLIRRPWVTEKAVALSRIRQYVFLVDGKASALEVKKAVQDLYSVTVEDVHMINVTRRKMNRGRPGKSVRMRKAVVTLAEGQELDIVPK